MSELPNPYLSTRQAAKLLGISPQAVLKRINSGQLKASKIGRSYAIPPSACHKSISSADQTVIEISEYVSVMQAARLLGLTRFAIFKRIERGLIEARRVGRHYVIHRNQLATEQREPESPARSDYRHEPVRQEGFISIPECAQLLGISRIAVFRQVKSGKLPATKVGRHYVIARKLIAGSVGPDGTIAESANRYCSVIEAARRLGISRIAVFKRIQNGKIKAVKIGRSYAIEKESLPDITPC